MSATDTLSALLMEAVVPLPERWRVPEQAALLAQARPNRTGGRPRRLLGMGGEEISLDPQMGQRAQRRLPAFKYFSGGMLNVCDNCRRPPRRGPGTRCKAGHHLGRRARRHVTLTYAQLRTAVARFANGLRSLGVVQGDVVAIYLPNLPEASLPFRRATGSRDLHRAVRRVLRRRRGAQAADLARQGAGHGRPPAIGAASASHCWRTRGEPVPAPPRLGSRGGGRPYRIRAGATGR